MRTALVIVICLVATACAATVPTPRPLVSGFASGAGVADPYEDGKLHLAAGRYELAIKRFGQALASDQRSLDALNGLGIAYTRLRRFEVAQTYFERALRADPTSVPTLNNYGWSLSEQGRLRDARPFLELALRRAEQADVPVVAGNVESIRRARPTALVAALQGSGSPEAQPGPYRLIRVDHNAYRLETTAVSPAEPQPDLDGKPRSPIVTETARTGHASASAAHSWAEEPERHIPGDARFGGASIQLWPEPASEVEAGPLPAGD